MRDELDVPIPAELALPDDGSGPPDDDDLDLYLAARDGDLASLMDQAVRPDDVEKVSATVERVRSFVLDDDGHAEYYMRRMAETGRDEAGIRAQAEEWIARINAWVEQQVGPITRRREWWQFHLEDYAVRRRIRRLRADPKDSRAKTLTLPSGKVPTTRRAPAAKIVDGDAMVAWLDAKAKEAKVDPEKEGWIRVKREPDAAKVKSMIEYKGSDEDGWTALIDGEIPPGVEVEGVLITGKVKPS